MKPLETISNVAVIIAAGAIAVTSIYDHLVRPTVGPGGPASTFSQQYKGKHMPLTGFEAGSGAATLVLFVSTTCHFCEESIPFYRRLAAMRSGSAGRFKMIAAVPQAVETEAGAKAYFSERGLALDGAKRAPFHAMGVSATPTLALVGNDGLVTDVWVGKLAPAKESEVVKRIEHICHSCSPVGSAVGDPQ